MSKLLPCPHCGETEHLYPAYHGLGGGEPYAIDCLGCGADYEPREGFDVIALWNRRTPDPAALQSRVTQLEEALRQARDFIADEYRDPSREPAGDWIAKEARPVFDNICTALGDANAPR